MYSHVFVSQKKKQLCIPMFEISLRRESDGRHALSELTKKEINRR